MPDLTPQMERELAELEAALAPVDCARRAPRPTTPGRAAWTR